MMIGHHVGRVLPAKSRAQLKLSGILFRLDPETADVDVHEFASTFFEFPAPCCFYLQLCEFTSSFLISPPAFGFYQQLSQCTSNPLSHQWM